MKVFSEKLDFFRVFPSFKCDFFCLCVLTERKNVLLASVQMRLKFDVIFVNYS